MTDSGLIEALRRDVTADAPVERRAGRAAERICAGTGRRWVGIYRVTGREVRNLGWSGPAPPAYPTFPADQGLTGAAIRSGSTVVSNDVATDPRYLTNQDTTGSELIVPILIAGRRRRDARHRGPSNERLRGERCAPVRTARGHAHRAIPLTPTEKHMNPI